MNWHNHLDKSDFVRGAGHRRDSELCLNAADLGGWLHFIGLQLLLSESTLLTFVVAEARLTCSKQAQDAAPGLS